MKDLAVRLAALDADAGAALRVIAYFDGLAENKAGLQAIVRGAAVLAGCPARLDDRSRRVHVRVDPDGHAAPDPSAADERWMRTPVVPDASAVLWLERIGEPARSRPWCWNVPPAPPARSSTAPAARRPRKTRR